MIRRSINRTLRRRWREERGHAGTEYAILLAVLVLGAMVAIGGIGSRVYNIYQAIEDAVAFFA